MDDKYQCINSAIRVTVYFEELFWMGVVEREEENKMDRTVRSKEQRRAQEERLWEMKQTKKKEKRKGR